MTNNTKRPRVTRSLTTILASGFLALSVVVLLVSNGLWLYSNLRSQQTAVYSRQQLIARDASKTVSNFFQEKFTVLETAVDVANPVELSNQERQITLDSLLGLQPAFRQLALLDIDDQLLNSASRLSQIATESISRRLTDDALMQIHQGNNYISPVYIDEATSEPLVIMAIPVTDIFGDFQGTLAVEVNLKFMWDLVDQLEVGETGYAYVVDEEGRLIAYRDTALVLRGENVSYIEEVQEFTESLSSPEAIEPDIANHAGLSGEDVVTTYESLGTPQWAVVVELPVQEAYQDLIAQIYQSILFIIGVAILASLVGIYGARRLSKPLIELTGTANQIADGELGLQATASGSIEVASLATAFNSMTLQLRNLIEGLEQRVSERTADAEQARIISERRAQELLSISEISRIISTEQRLDVLLSLIARLVSERFSFGTRPPA
jgi:HAMP domain-containing protein